MPRQTGWLMFLKERIADPEFRNQHAPQQRLAVLGQLWSILTAEEKLEWKAMARISQGLCVALTNKGKLCRNHAKEGGLCGIHLLYH